MILLHDLDDPHHRHPQLHAEVVPLLLVLDVVVVVVLDDDGHRIANSVFIVFLGFSCQPVNNT